MPQVLCAKTVTRRVQVIPHAESNGLQRSEVQDYIGGDWSMGIRDGTANTIKKLLGTFLRPEKAAEVCLQVEVGPGKGQTR